MQNQIAGVHGKPFLRRCIDVIGIHRRNVKIENTTACAANHVRMRSLLACVIQHGTIDRGHLMNNAEIGEELQGRVDRRQ